MALTYQQFASVLVIDQHVRSKANVHISDDDPRPMVRLREPWDRTPSESFWEEVIEGRKQYDMLMRVLPKKSNKVIVNLHAVSMVCRRSKFPERDGSYWIMRNRQVSEANWEVWFEDANPDARLAAQNIPSDFEDTIL